MLVYMFYTPRVVYTEFVKEHWCEGLFYKTYLCSLVRVQIHRQTVLNHTHYDKLDLVGWWRMQFMTRSFTLLDTEHSMNDSVCVDFWCIYIRHRSVTPLEWINRALSVFTPDSTRLKGTCTGCNENASEWSVATCPCANLYICIRYYCIWL